MNIRTSTINDKAFYDIVTALRGPDHNHLDGAVAAKNMTTSVIRSLAGIKEGMGGSVVTPREAREDWGMYSQTRQAEVLDFMQKHSHFRDHVRKAFTALARQSSTARSYRTFLRQKGVLV